MLATFLKAAAFCVLVITSTFSIAGEAKKPEVFGVLFYADWCGSCKILDPKLTEVKARHALEDKSVLFLKLDFTDETTTSQAELLVNAIGMNEVYAEYGDKTGFMLLIDADTKKVISRVSKRMKNSEIAGRIQHALKQAKS